MSESKHTNSKWYVADMGNHQGLIIDEETGENIAVCYDKADAPLITAAPDLLEACKASLKEIKNVLAVAYDSTGRRPKTSIENKLEAAIAEAEKEVIE